MILQYNICLFYLNYILSYHIDSQYNQSIMYLELKMQSVQIQYQNLTFKTLSPFFNENLIFLVKVLDLTQMKFLNPFL